MKVKMTPIASLALPALLALPTERPCPPVCVRVFRGNAFRDRREDVRRCGVVEPLPRRGKPLLGRRPFSCVDARNVRAPPRAIRLRCGFQLRLKRGAPRLVATATPHVLPGQSPPDPPDRPDRASLSSVASRCGQRARLGRPLMDASVAAEGSRGVELGHGRSFPVTRRSRVPPKSAP